MVEQKLSTQNPFLQNTQTWVIFMSPFCFSKGLCHWLCLDWPGWPGFNCCLKSEPSSYESLFYVYIFYYQHLKSAYSYESGQLPIYRAKTFIMQHVKMKSIAVLIKILHFQMPYGIENCLHHFPGRLKDREQTEFRGHAFPKRWDYHSKMEFSESQPP